MFRKYYEDYALACDNVQGPILASLLGKSNEFLFLKLNLFFRLVGPCALEFTRMKTSDHIWTDPHADELVQRHRMHTSNRTNNTNNSLKYRPNLQMNVILFPMTKKIFIFSFLFSSFQLKRHASSSGEEAQKHHQLISVNPARDYVESLHQNARSQLIYGKNNVYVQPVE